MCIHVIKGNLYAYKHIRSSNKVHSIYLGPVSGSGSWTKGSYGDTESGYGQGQKGIHETPIKVSEETIQRLKDSNLSERKQIVQDISKTKEIKVVGSNVTTYFNGVGEIIDQNWKDEEGTTFKLPSVSSPQQREKIYTRKSMEHPAKMYVPLAQKLVQEYSEPGDTVLDPMAGIGTTGIEASRFGRNAILVDYEKRFVNESKKNSELLEESGQKIGDIKVLHGDARNLGNIKNVDVVITSPPFANVLAGSSKDDTTKFKHGSAGKDYTTNHNDEKQIGNLKGERFYQETIKVYKECHKVLKSDGKLIVHMKNPIKNKEIVRLDQTTIIAVEQADFKLKERRKRHIDNPSFWTNLYRKNNPDAPKVDHEDILVFEKK